MLASHSDHHEAQPDEEAELQEKFTTSYRNTADRWLFGAYELGEEASFREDLVDQDGTDRVDLFVRLVVEQVIGDRLPHAGGLIGFRGIGDGEVLEQRIGRLRNVLVGDGDKVVIHESCPDLTP